MEEITNKEPWTLEKQLEHLQGQKTRAEEAVIKLQGAIELMEGMIAAQPAVEAE